jgi:hypothetical protein
MLISRSQHEIKWKFSVSFFWSLINSSSSPTPNQHQHMMNPKRLLTKTSSFSSNSRLFLALVLLCFFASVLNFILTSPTFHLFRPNPKSQSLYYYIQHNKPNKSYSLAPISAKSSHSNQIYSNNSSGIGVDRKEYYDLVVVTSVKDMAPYLPEWIEHHHLLGTYILHL